MYISTSKSAFVLALLLLFFAKSQAQTTGMASNNTNALAANIADRMKDSLGLSTAQRDQVNTLNLQISNQKQNVRSRFANRDSITVGLQKVENGRDSLYKTVLTEQQYIIYRQKKRTLIAAN